MVSVADGGSVLVDGGVVVIAGPRGPSLVAQSADGGIVGPADLLGFGSPFPPVAVFLQGPERFLMVDLATGASALRHAPFFVTANCTGSAYLSGNASVLFLTGAGDRLWGATSTAQANLTFLSYISETTGSCTPQNFTTGAFPASEMSVTGYPFGPLKIVYR